jgi:hypothetical protein
VALSIGHGAEARVQYRYPGGYGGCGWGGWGDAQTPGSSMARGMGIFAAGAGMYNENTAAARSMNADTTMRWNEYIYESSRVAAKKHSEFMRRRKQFTIERYNKIHD